MNQRGSNEKGRNPVPKNTYSHTGHLDYKREGTEPGCVTVIAHASNRYSRGGLLQGETGKHIHFSRVYNVKGKQLRTQLYYCF